MGTTATLASPPSVANVSRKVSRFADDLEALGEDLDKATKRLNHMKMRHREIQEELRLLAPQPRRARRSASAGHQIVPSGSAIATP